MKIFIDFLKISIDFLEFPENFFAVLDDLGHEQNLKKSLGKSMKVLQTPPLP